MAAIYVLVMIFAAIRAGEADNRVIGGVWFVAALSNAVAAGAVWPTN